LTPPLSKTAINLIGQKLKNMNAPGKIKRNFGKIQMRMALDNVPGKIAQSRALW